MCRTSRSDEGLLATIDGQRFAVLNHRDNGESSTTMEGQGYVVPNDRYNGERSTTMEEKTGAHKLEPKYDDVSYRILRVINYDVYDGNDCDEKPRPTSDRTRSQPNNNATMTMIATL